MAFAIPPQRRNEKPVLLICSIVLNGMKFIPKHLEVLDKLRIPYFWAIAEGTAASVKDTSWVKPMPPGLSDDGTTRFLIDLNHPRVLVTQKPLWQGKTEQINAALDLFPCSGILHHMDIDEVWDSDQLEKIVTLFHENPNIGHMRYYCKYRVGKNIITTGDGYGNHPTEWARSWRWDGKERFKTHEPPNLKFSGATMRREETRRHGLVFDHFSWSDEETVLKKIRYYQYGEESFEKWKLLQKQTVFPCRLKDFMPWVDDLAMAERA